MVLSRVLRFRSSNLSRVSGSHVARCGTSPRGVSAFGSLYLAIYLSLSFYRALALSYTASYTLQKLLSTARSAPWKWLSKD